MADQPRRRFKVLTKWDLITEQEREKLDRMPLELKCTGCGRELTTEGEFARHFYLRDTRFPNLGWCPIKDGVAEEAAR
jgi:hypothetical protein